MTTRIVSRIAGAAAACLMALPVSADFSFRSIAPEDATSLFVINDMSETMERLEGNGMMEVWRDDRIQRWMEDFTARTVEDFGQDLDALGISIDDLEWPTGQVGMATWVRMTEDEFGEMAPTPFNLLAVDYGDRADDMEEMIVEAIRNAAEDEQIRLEEDEYAGRETFSLFPIEEEGAEDWDNWEMEPSLMENPIGAMLPEIVGGEEMHWTRVDDVFIAASSLEDLHRAMDRYDDDDLPSMAVNATVDDALSRLGDADAWMVVFGERMLEMMMRDPMAGAFLEDSGIESLRTLGVAADMSSDDGMMEARGFLLADEMKGAMKIVDGMGESLDPPAFISADTANLTRLRLDFEELMDFVRQTFEAAAAEDPMAGMIEPQLKMIEPAVRAMGPEVYMSARIVRPLGPESQRSLIAVRARDPQTIGAVIDELGAGMGLEPRDFQGNQIWSAGPNGFFPINLGLGGGHIFFGSEADIEAALRAASGDVEIKLANENTFKRALQTLENDGFIHMYSDSARLAPFARWQRENAGEAVRKMFGEVPDGEEIPDWQQEMIDDMIAEAESAFPYDIVLEHMGPTVTEIRQTDEGFVGRWIMLRPLED